MQRWIIKYVPWERFKALAVKNGADANLDSFMDFADPDDCTETISAFQTKRGVLRRAKGLVPIDVWGEVRIIRQHYRPTELTLGVWDNHEYWLVYHDTKDLDWSQPDGTYAA